MIELTPKQTQVINVCIGKKVSVILGEVGSGKSVTSVSPSLPTRVRKCFADNGGRFAYV